MPSSDETEDARLHEAALWLDRLESGRGSEDAFERWRADPANAIAFIRVSRTASLARGAVTDATPRAQPSQSPLTRRRLVAGIGLTVVAAGSGLLAYSVVNDRAVAMTDVGERSSLSLPSGGRLDVNTDSKVTWKFKGEKRDIWLKKGEAAVTVPVGSGPVTLHAGKATFLLNEGIFNIRLTDDKPVFVTLEGNGLYVDPDDKSAEAPVPVGRAATITGASVQVSPIALNAVDALTAWRNDEIVLDGVSLKDAVQEYNRYLKTKLVLAEPGLGEIVLGGRFATKDPTEFLSALRTSFGLSVRTGTDGAVIIDT